MLDYYYDLYRNEYREDNDDNIEDIHQFCDTNVNELSKKDCIQLINEQFGDIINAILEHRSEFDDDLFDGFRNDIEIYHCLAYYSLLSYIKEKIYDNNLSDADTEINDD
jgi:hypothetical protein